MRLAKNAYTPPMVNTTPRQFLADLEQAHLNKTDDQLLALVIERLTEGDAVALLPAVVGHWFRATLSAIRRGPPAPTAAPERAQRVAAIAKTITARAVQMVLMDLTLANGKPLRDATADDCRKSGGWLLAVADKVPAGKRVGQALSETDLRNLYGSNRNA